MFKMLKAAMALKNFVFTLIFIKTCSSSINTSGSVWHEAGEITTHMLEQCLREEISDNKPQFFKLFANCLRHKSISILDQSLNADVINIGPTVQIVKMGQNTTLLRGSANRSDKRSFIIDKDWRGKILQRIAHFLDTHTMKIYFNGDVAARGRGRRKKDNMMVSLLVFAMVAVGLIVIPMGFQFLAVLGGKALLLAKLALILSSIQGLKKIATSGLNYGLYAQTAPGAWHYDRQWPYGYQPTADMNSQLNYDMPENYNELLHPRIDVRTIKRYET